MKYAATTGQTRKMGILALMATLLTLVYIFGASPYANDGTFRTLQAQGNNGAITGLTLTSDTPGTLTVSWETTSPVPTDHRVDWAKTGEDYQSWKVDDGHLYPAPSATTATIADLGTRHRVQDSPAYPLLQRRIRGQILGRPMGHRHHHGCRNAGDPVQHSDAWLGPTRTGAPRSPQPDQHRSK